MQTVAETSVFAREAARLLSPEEYESLIVDLAANPGAGVPIQGCGGVRKLRWFARGRGKRSGARVIYYYFDETTPLYALLIYGKNAKADLSSDERRQVAQLAQLIKATVRTKRKK